MVISDQRITWGIWETVGRGMVPHDPPGSVYMAGLHILDEASELTATECDWLLKHQPVSTLA